MDNRKEMAKEGNGSALDTGHNVLCQRAVAQTQFLWLQPDVINISSL